MAGELGDALFATEPRADLIAEYRKAGGQGLVCRGAARVGAIGAQAAESAGKLFRFGVTGWKVQSELPNPVNFDAATELVTADHMAEQFGCGPDVERHVRSRRSLLPLATTSSPDQRRP